MTCAEADEAGAPEPVLIGCGPGALARRGKGSQRLQWAEVPWRRTRGHYDASALTTGLSEEGRNGLIADRYEGVAGRSPTKLGGIIEGTRAVMENKVRTPGGQI